MSYKEYSEEAIEELKAGQNKFRNKFDIDNYDNWFYNQSSEILRLYSDGKECFFKYVPIGSYSTNTNTWMWAWSNEHSVEPSKYDTLKIKEFGEKESYESLTHGHFEGDKYTGWELTAISFQILGGIGTYKVDSDHLEKYFLIIEQVSKNEVDRIEKELIECNVHGKIRKAFICQHLNKDYRTGFEEAFETVIGMKLDEDDDLQAWCDDCEKERIKTDGWNDESMEYAQIKLICERCYFEIKELNN